jgi:hypothetical protein
MFPALWVNVIAAYRETFTGSLNSGKAGKNLGPHRRVPGGVSGAMFRLRAALALSFAPNRRYVGRGEAAGVRGRLSRLLVAAFQTIGPLPTPPGTRHG